MSKTNDAQYWGRCVVVLLLGIFGFASQLSARDKSDVIVMNNGDRITCEIKSLRSDTLRVSVDYILNTISVDWNKVDHIESKQLFLVKTQDGLVHKGALSTPKTSGERPVEIDILKAGEKKVAVERKQVTELSETSENFFQRFNGQFSSGFTFTKGNEATQYNLSTDVDYIQEHWSVGASYSSNLSSSVGSSTSTRNDLTFTGSKLTRWDNWYYTGIGDFLQSSTQGISLQSTLGGGMGRNIKNSGSTYFTVYGGFAWQQINYNQAKLAAETQHVSSALIGTNLKLFQFKRTTLTVGSNFLPALSDPGRVHFDLNSTYYVKLWGEFNWNFTFYDNWDNRPPPGFSSSDYGTSTGLSFNFGNR